MDWQKRYQDKLMCPEAACALIRSGDVAASNFGGSIPYAFLDVLADYAREHLENVTLYLAGFYKQTKIAEAKYNSHITVKSCFQRTAIMRRCSGALCITASATSGSWRSRRRCGVRSMTNMTSREQGQDSASNKRGG